MLNNVKEIHIEPTSLCNAECPMCTRNINGKGLNPYITLKSLDREWFELNLKPEQIKKLDKVFLCGNVGDPASTPELLEIIEYFKNCNPDMWLSMNTNAGAQEESWWEELAETFGRMGTVIFSLDGLKDTNHLYRKGVNWDKVMSAMTAFTSTKKAQAVWEFLVFEHNQHQIAEARQLSEQ